ncbi:hypothetical protein KQX54_020964 [Cotesia glomerata]|uniref:Uncharacterized protein n=1 Tax=Cotesia glomerata TaxID=32391 RepID=A0AAV7J6M6_COTGL|nr:hypothetical protein KQX54_020964 [Cotesia glomerata]
MHEEVKESLQLCRTKLLLYVNLPGSYGSHGKGTMKSKPVYPGNNRMQRILNRTESLKRTGVSLPTQQNVVVVFNRMYIGVVVNFIVSSRPHGVHITWNHVSALVFQESNKNRNPTALCIAGATALVFGATEDPQVIISHAYSPMVVCKLIETCTCSTTTCYSFWY